MKIAISAKVKIHDESNDEWRDIGVPIGLVRYDSRIHEDFQVCIGPMWHSDLGTFVPYMQFNLSELEAAVACVKLLAERDYEKRTS